ncbi:MAG TPA: hypothetical protein ENJ12_00960 [Thiolapillus brandeum]|uniref:Uncharacterized protein n=1 Tax=Thiolapillus brandeum TaxID=1076588 RepID=A0A831RR09_9GAMM|nr:hypothetical protein [Thiolapillus brandeum]
MTRETYRNSPWLDNRKACVDGVYHPISLDLLIPYHRQSQIQAPPRHYIFHTSHCCSTLLARCLDALTAFMALKEPVTLRQLSELKRNINFPVLEANGQWRQLVNLIESLLSRTGDSEVTALIKLTSICHNLIPDLLASDDARGIFLYSDLTSHMASMYKDKARIDTYLEVYFPYLVHDMGQLCAGSSIRPDSLETHEKLALMWVARILFYLRHRNQHAIAHLNSKQFLDHPRKTMNAVCDHLQVRVSSREIDAVITGPLLKHEAKWRNMQYDARSRHLEQNVIVRNHESEIQAAHDWASQWLPSPDLLEDIPGDLCS